MHHDQARFDTAARHFRAFFKELGSHFIEREEILAQFGLGLLSREHVLMCGPPGTAKSQMASAVLGRILDESTGKPSVFARQFTESTVQTDLIGPINFKTLLETGRTEHFTDEGMLGAVHAFLDEVLDGRDMLLRSTLNLMLEREVKQGSKISKGAIECAFMTSNRYVAEILESSRETLLAFIDRIAFIGFVPRGFANDDSLRDVVRRHAGGLKPPPLSATLTIQDLDVLQSATEDVFVSSSICDAVVQLIETLDTELAEASRADATFVATRYLSTRSIVRAVRILRATVVWSKIMTEPERELSVAGEDVPWLRVHLLLGGLTADRAAKRLAKETDPRERRQLEIVRIEREIFNRCLKGLPEIKRETRPKVDVARLRQLVDHATSSDEPRAVIDVVPSLAEAAASGASGSSDANELLKNALASLIQRALRQGMTPEIDSGGGVKALLDSLWALAEQIDASKANARPIALWLRGRAMAISDEACAFGPPERSSIDDRLDAVEKIAELRERLVAGGCDPHRVKHVNEPWLRFVARFVDDLAPIVDAELCGTAKAVLSKRTDALGESLAALGPAFERIRAIDSRLIAIGADTSLKRRTLLPRLGPLVETVFGRIDSKERRNLIKQVLAIYGELLRAGVADAIPPARILEWSAQALLRTAQPIPQLPASDQWGYDALRTHIDARSATDALIEIAIDVLTLAGSMSNVPASASLEVIDEVRKIGDPLAEKIIAHDCAVMDAQIDYLERWWQTQPRKIAQGDFLRTTRGGGAFLALSIETRTIEEVFPLLGAEAAKLRARVEALDKETAREIAGQRQAAVDEAWTTTVKTTVKTKVKTKK